MDLYKDKKYVKLIENTINKLTEGYENKAFWTRPGETSKKYLNKTLYNRVYNALITQPDKAFLETIEKALKNKTPIAQLAEQLKTKEDGLLRENKPFLGTEGHHIFHQNTVQRIRKFPVAQQLEILHKFRKLGGTSGVVPENLTYLSRMAHRANLFKDKVREVTGHINPFTLGDDTGYWSNDYDFDPERLNLDDLDPEKLTLDDVADALHNEAYGPQEMLARNAALRKSQVKAKQWFKDLLGGTDLFDQKLPASVRNKYKKILSKLEIPDFGVISEAFERGEIPELPNKGEIFPEIDALNKQFQKSGLIPKVVSAVKKGGTVNLLTSAGRAVARPTLEVSDVVIPDPETVKTFEEQGTKAGLKAYGQELFGEGAAFATTAGLLKGASYFAPQAMRQVTAKGAAAFFGGPPGVIITGLSVANQLDESFFEGKGKQALQDSQYSYLDPFLGKDAGKKAKEQIDKNFEDSNYSQLRSFTGM